MARPMQLNEKVRCGALSVNDRGKLTQQEILELIFLAGSMGSWFFLSFSPATLIL
jgi:hypothetical protein